MEITPQPGDFVEIIANTSHHPFEIGDQVAMIPWADADDFDDDGTGIVCRYHNSRLGAEAWYVAHEDYKFHGVSGATLRLREERDHYKNAMMCLLAIDPKQVEHWPTVIESILGSALKKYGGDTHAQD